MEMAGFGSRQREIEGKDWTLDRAVEDLRDAVARTAASRVVVIGSSLGGSVALALAAEPSEKLAAVVTIGTAARWVATDDYEHGLGREQADHILAEGRARFAGFAREAIPAFHLNDDDQTEARRAFALFEAEIARTEDFERSMAILERVYRDVDIRPLLPAIRVPVLLLHGEKDLVAAPAAGDFMQKRLANAEVRIILGAGHLPMLTRPQETAAAIADFLDRQHDL